MIAHHSLRASEPETTAPDLRKSDTSWQLFLGVGVATMVGLACVSLIEQLARSLTRKI
jgi:hypothetical protein